MSELDVAPDVFKVDECTFPNRARSDPCIERQRYSAGEQKSCNFYDSHYREKTMKRHKLKDYAVELEKAESFSQSLDYLMEICANLGYTQISYACQNFSPRLFDGRWLPLKLNVRNFPSGWEYGWERFSVHDPYYHECFQGTLPFDWNDLQNSGKLQPLERQAWQYLADIGLGRGVTTPVHFPDGRFAVLSAIVDKSNVNWFDIKHKTQDLMLDLTHLYRHTLLKMDFERQIPVADPFKLSRREKECLHWSGAGKTAPEIAIILGLSPETIRMYLKKARCRLGTHTTAQAVVNAAQLHLVSPYFANN